MKAVTVFVFSGFMVAGLLLFRIDTRPALSSGGASFRSDVLPILVAGGCTYCHGDNGGLDVTSVRALLAGGDSGPAVVPGNADSSLLLQVILPQRSSGVRMPPEGSQLSESAVNAIRAWINEGAKEN